MLTGLWRMLLAKERRSTEVRMTLYSATSYTRTGTQWRCTLEAAWACWGTREACFALPQARISCVIRAAGDRLSMFSLCISSNYEVYSLRWKRLPYISADVLRRTRVLLSLLQTGWLRVEGAR